MLLHRLRSRPRPCLVLARRATSVLSDGTTSAHADRATQRGRRRAGGRRGPGDENARGAPRLRRVPARNVVTLDGSDEDVAMGETVIREFTDLVRQGHDISPGTIRAISAALDRHESPSRILEDVVWRHRALKVAPKTVNQKRYVDAIRRSTITVGIGPAGTGKSFLAVAMAVAALSRREVNRIVLTRPAVEAGERLGFLPGDLMAKVDPYLRPLF